MTQRTETELALALLNIQAIAEREHRATAETLHRGRTRTIELARRYNVPWDTIGTVLQTTGEAARKQYERGL
jgi:hypothetical protein